MIPKYFFENERMKTVFSSCLKMHRLVHLVKTSTIFNAQEFLKGRRNKCWRIKDYQEQMQLDEMN